MKHSHRDLPDMAGSHSHNLPANTCLIPVIIYKYTRTLCSLVSPSPSLQLFPTPFFPNHDLPPSHRRYTFGFRRYFDQLS